MKCSMTGQTKGDCLIEVTAWAGLTVVEILLTLNYYQSVL